MLRGCFALVFGVVGLLAAACSSDTPKKALSDGCVLSSDCAGGLVCTFGRCHTACATSKDCPAGESCVKASGDAAVCQLPVEAQCTNDRDCPAPLICGADQQCRGECQSNADCPTGQKCTNDKTCAEPAQVDSNNNLINSSDAGAGGSSHAGGSPGIGGGKAGGSSNAGGGGATSAGGAAPAGGVTAAGGIASIGGVSNAGGTKAAGGASPAGGATSAGAGGVISVGGVSSAGGSKATGGASSTGGSKVAGGTSSVGGVTSIGGVSSTGGSKATGGAVSAGGTAGTGGVACTAESDFTFCARLNRACGSYTGFDNCGVVRTVANCGTCTGTDQCNAFNRCSGTAVTTWLDCNGNSTDGAETPILYNSDNCGACANKVDIYQNGMGLCDQGQIRLLTCDVGWKANAAGTACDQCNSYLGGLDIPDNGIDEDCNGADATNSPTRGLYLDPTNGSDAGDGTAANPFKSFGGLLDVGWTANPTKREVYVALGTLTDSLVTVDGLIIVGGYTRSATNVWTRTPAARSNLHAPGVAFDFTRGATANRATFAVEGISFLIDSGATRRGVVQGSNSQLILQNVEMQGTGSGYLVYQNASGFAGLLIAHATLTGTSVPTVGRSGGCQGSLELYNVNTNAAIDAAGGSMVCQDSTVAGVTINAGTGATTNVVEYRCTGSVTGGTYMTSYRHSGALNHAGSSPVSIVDMRGSLAGSYTICPSGLGARGGDVTVGTTSYCYLPPATNARLTFSYGASCAITDSYASVQSSIGVGGQLLNSRLIGASSTDQTVTFQAVNANRNVFSGVDISAPNGGTAYIYDNLFLPNQQSGSTTLNLRGSLVFTNNTVIGPGDASGLINVTTTGAKLYNNVLAATGTATDRIGIYETGASYVTALRNNTFANFTVLMVAGGGTNVTALTTLNTLATIPTTESGSNLRATAFTDLMFADPTTGNYMPLATSPLVDVGLNTSDAAHGTVTTDFLGHTRPCGTAYDIGAYEYCP